MRNLFLTFALFLSAACGTSSDPSGPEDRDAGGATEDPVFATRVQPILDRRCVACHFDGGIGSFSLTEFDDATMWANLARQAVSSETMPPFPPRTQGCAPFDDARQMPPDERSTFVAWASGESIEQGDEPSSASMGRAEFRAPDHRWPIEGEYVAPVEVTEEHRCFRVDPRLTDVTRFEAIHVDTASLERFHQAQVYVLPPERVAEAQELEQRDGRPGWSCFFDPGMEGLRAVGRFLPGLGFRPFPEEAAIALEPGSQLVIDAYLHHYDYEPLDLAAVAWEGAGAKTPVLLELMDEELLVPAGATSARTDLEASVADLGGPEAGRLWEVGVHMRHWGRTTRVELLRGNGTSECLLDIPTWDPEWQGRYRLRNPVDFGPDDRIVASCEWSNTLIDQPIIDGVVTPTRDLRWGMKESDETCSVELMVLPD